MLQKNLMEDKPLNFDQPFLSVRRHTPVATSVRTGKRRMSSSLTSIPQLPSHRPELKSGPIRNAGAVPFLWEQSPGQPKEELKPQNCNFDEPPVAPRLPPGRHPKADQAVDSPRADVNDRRDVDVKNSSLDGNVEGNKEENECSESGDEAYVVALDTLSKAESSFLNCSMSGLSDLDVKPLADRQAREFMMERFLPAAKAMASETIPQYAPKKQPLPQKQPKKEVNQYKPSLRYGPSFADRYSYMQDNKEEEEEEEESEDEYDQPQNVPALCGMLPRFCLRSSLCLLSPVPAMSVRTRVPSSSARKVERRYPSAGSCNKVEDEFRSNQAELKSIDEIQAAEVDRENAEVRNDSGHVASVSSSTHASLPFLEDKEVHSVAEEKPGFKTFQELLDGRRSPDESSSGDPIIEKTLYVDTVQKVEPPGLWSFSLKKRDANGVPNLGDEDHEIIAKRIDQKSIEDSSLEDLKKLIAVDMDKKLLPNDQDFKVISQGSTESIEKHFSKAVTVKKCQSHPGLPAPPPLPKSPSDSWLWRTLPSTKSSSLRSYLDSTTKDHEKQLNTVPKSDHKKWETIVKAANVKHHHLRYSEEMLTPIPET